MHPPASEPGDSPVTVTCQPAALMLQVGVPDAGVTVTGVVGDWCQGLVSRQFVPQFGLEE